MQATQPANGQQTTYHQLSKAGLEAIPAKSPHRKYMVLLVMHLVETDDATVLCDAADCSERTLHYVKKRLSKDDGVIINYDRTAGRYVVIQSGVLNLARIAELMQRLYPARIAYIRALGERTRNQREAG